MTASRSEPSMPAMCKASFAASTPISAITDSSLSARSGMDGVILWGSRIPALSSTNRERIPDAFSMNSAEEWVFGCSSPSAMASALSSLKISTQLLKAATSSSLLMDSRGV